jgi:hemerythrin-like domain-containing protein
MLSNAQDIMRELREDHRNMALVLKLLDGIVVEMKAGEDPDFELLAEIMSYMTIYPDAVHHPKEDVVYEELRARRPDLAEDLDNVPEDHREIARLGCLLREEVDAVNAGAAVLRETMIEDTAAYVRRLRDHMIWEEEDLFRRIDLMLDAMPYKIDMSEYDNIKDPVFELEVAAGFRRLIDSLQSG